MERNLNQILDPPKKIKYQIPLKKNPLEYQISRYPRSTPPPPPILTCDVNELYGDIVVGHAVLTSTTLLPRIEVNFSVINTLTGV